MPNGHVSIKPTEASEAEMLAQIQQAAFLPLYARYQDAGNPCLRGAEDILKRLNADNRYYTILLDGRPVGGIFYCVRGKCLPDRILQPGEYYLARVYVHPDLQGRGIAARRSCSASGSLTTL